jgi:hypothetical protein
MWRRINVRIDILIAPHLHDVEVVINNYLSLLQAVDLR